MLLFLLYVLLLVSIKSTNAKRTKPNGNEKNLESKIQMKTYIWVKIKFYNVKTNQEIKVMTAILTQIKEILEIKIFMRMKVEFLYR